MGELIIEHITTDANFFHQEKKRILLDIYYGFSIQRENVVRHQLTYPKNTELKCSLKEAIAWCYENEKEFIGKVYIFSNDIFYDFQFERVEDATSFKLKFS